MNARQDRNGNDALAAKTSFEMLEDSKWLIRTLKVVIHFVLFCDLEVELDRAESFLSQRYARKRDYRAKTLEIAEKRRRRWMVQKGKSKFLDFSD